MKPVPITAKLGTSLSFFPLAGKICLEPLGVAG
jgi:hypothetical protein